MHVIGHIAVAILEHRFLTASEQGKIATSALFVASLFPDIVDKSIGYLFKLMPNGRHYAHNLFSLALFSVTITFFLGKTAGYGWFLGHLGHMLADISRDGQPPWLFPAKKYKFHRGRGIRLIPKSLGRELLFLGLALLITRLSRRISPK